MNDITPANSQDAKKQLLLIAVPVLIFTILAFLFLLFINKPKENTETTTPTKTTEQKTATQETKTKTTDSGLETVTYQNIKSPHFVSSTPANNVILTTGPSQVTINFNFDLGPGSKIEVIVDGNSVVAQEAKVSSDKLSMTALVNPVEPGNYQVKYTACWPDGSCHEGSFGFSVKTN